MKSAPLTPCLSEIPSGADQAANMTLASQRFNRRRQAIGQNGAPFGRLFSSNPHLFYLTLLLVQPLQLVVQISALLTLHAAHSNGIKFVLNGHLVKPVVSQQQISKVMHRQHHLRVGILFSQTPK